MAEPKIALVYDWLTNYGGGERNLLAAHKAFPHAPIYTSVYIPETVPQFANADVRTTYLQRLPTFLRRWHQLLPVFRPRAFRSLNLDDYDIVLSMGSAEAKAVRKRRDAWHINYCFTPTRYYWSHYEEYKQNPGFGPLNPLIRLVIPPFVTAMRAKDLQAASGVDTFIGNSSAVATRIKKYYGKEAAVVYPPVDMTRFRGLDITGARSGFVVVGRQVPYKRMDLAILACNELGLKLTLYGNGPEHKRLKSMGGPTVHFIADADDATVAQALSKAAGFLFPQEEDFGITQVEAMAAGCPVVAYGKGGAIDVVVDGKTGTFFSEQSTEALKDAIARLTTMRFTPKVLQMHAEQFSEERFIKELREFVALKEHSYLNLNDATSAS
jgi:glycosyltransferase involved in cell wall biosynthesis